MTEKETGEAVTERRRKLLLAIGGAGLMAATAMCLPGFVGQALADDDDDDRSRRRRRPVRSRGRTRRRRDGDREED